MDKIEELIERLTVTEDERKARYVSDWDIPLNIEDRDYLVASLKAWGKKE